MAFDIIIGEMLSSFCEDCRAWEIASLTRMYQGEKYTGDWCITSCLQTTEKYDLIFHEVDKLIANSGEFKNAILHCLRRKKLLEISEKERLQLQCADETTYERYDIEIKSMRGYIEVLDWDWYVENNCKAMVGFCSYVTDWRLMLLETIVHVYCEEKYGKYQNYSDSCKLKSYLDSNGYHDELSSNNYGLLTIRDEWEIFPGKPSLIFLPEKDTHILIKFISSGLLAYLRSLREENAFTLSLRPDYEVCGDGIKRDRQRIEEEKEFGKGFEGTLESIKSVSKYYDDEWVRDWLVVNKDEKGVTFEEVLENNETDLEYVVTQMVHFQYEVNGDHEYFTHIGHEYIFYSVSEYSNKLIDVRQRGNERKRFKTFKIDNAHIRYENNPQRNLLYKVLCNYFTKGNLIDEYFHLMDN